MEDTTQRQGIAPDPARFFIPVELDRPRVLAFDSAATFLIYQRYGPGFFHEFYEREGEGQALRIRSHEALEFFLWAALQRDAKAAGETLTLEHVADQIVPTTIHDIAQALFVALAATRKPHRVPPKNA